jgi:Ca2+-binding EF-hand superfamily protein
LFDPNIQLGPEEKWDTPDGEIDEIQLSRTDVAALFAKIDGDGNGLIDSPELHAFVLSLGRSGWTEAGARAALRSIDADGNGLISLEEVLGWYASGGAKSPPSVSAAAAAARRLTREEVESIFQVSTISTPLP